MTKNNLKVVKTDDKKQKEFKEKLKDTHRGRFRAPLRLSLAFRGGRARGGMMRPFVLRKAHSSWSSAAGFGKKAQYRPQPRAPTGGKRRAYGPAWCASSTSR